VIGTAIFGLFFAMIVVVWGSIWPCIIGHALQDLIGGFIVSRRLAAVPEPPPMSSEPPPISPEQPPASQEPRLSG
jgi:hypothetical protein